MSLHRIHFRRQRRDSEVHGGRRHVFREITSGRSIINGEPVSSCARGSNKTGQMGGREGRDKRLWLPRVAAITGHERRI